jgi:hypothetical protein
VQISRDGTLLGVLSGGVSKFDDHQLWPSTTYDYTVTWLAANGNVLATEYTDVTTPPQTSPVVPFFPDSPYFSQPISGGATVLSNSTAMVASSITPYAQTSDLTDSDAWGIPVYYSNAGTQAYSPKCLLYWCNVSVGTPQIPADAQPSTGSDGHLAVLSDNGSEEFDMWQAQFDTTTMNWQASTMFGFNTDGTGVACPVTEGCSNATAASFAVTAGILRPEEIAQGQIDHALVITIPDPSTAVVCPATHTDGTNTSGTAIPEGSLLRLNPDVNVAALGLPAWEQTIARALQVYGAYVADTGGSLAIRAESNLGYGYDAWADAGVPENGANGAYLYQLPWSQMEVMTPPSSC